MFSLIQRGGWSRLASSLPARSGVPRPPAGAVRLLSGRADDSREPPQPERFRLSKVVASCASNVQMSRRSAERLIRDGMVSVAGKVVTDPSEAMTLEEAASGGGVVKVAGRRLVLEVPAGTAARRVGGGAGAANSQAAAALPGQARTRVWLVHKLPGEIVAENDPAGRPSLLDRLRRGGVGKPKRKKGQPGRQRQLVHLKPIGRLDMMTEGLLVVTNCGVYSRDMELPGNLFHRVYRARVHGRFTESKMRAIRNGIEIDGVRYNGMKVSIERKTGRRERSANTWVRVTCTEGKNRQIRKVFDSLGLKVTRLIRVSFGDYDLNTIPPGLAIEVPTKEVENQKRRGSLKTKSRGRPGARRQEDSNNDKATVQWVRHL